jgi:hypothetical protein
MTQPDRSGRLAAEGGRGLDVVGVGFGPANLALAAVTEEEARATGGSRTPCSRSSPSARRRSWSRLFRARAAAEPALDHAAVEGRR